MVAVNVRVNGRQFSADLEPRILLVDFIRETLKLKGTHRGCDTGHCGACTVIMDGKPVKSCQVLAVQADGADIVTVEGLEPKEGELSVEQEAFVENFAAQCGFCTPGMLMMTYYLIRKYPELTREEIREKLHGNYCMCTGYQQIVDAVQAAHKKYLATKK